MSSEKENEIKQESDDENLDELLDDALKDFQKPSSSEKDVDASGSNVDADVWSQEFVSAAKENFENTMKALIGNQDKENSEQIDVNSMTLEFEKFAQSAAKAASEAKSDQEFAQCLGETFQQMMKNNAEAQNGPNPEELSQMMEGLGLGSNGENFSELFPAMQTMLENILSKDVLYPPIKELVEKFPDWLADNRSALEESEYERYNKQFEIMKQIVNEFESNEAISKSSEAQENQEENTENNSTVKIVDLMQKLQELGQPPQALMGSEESEDPNRPSIPDLSKLMQGFGFPNLGAAQTGVESGQNSDGSSTQGEEQCCMM